jgi:hypothetical protein
MLGKYHNTGHYLFFTRPRYFQFIIHRYIKPVQLIKSKGKANPVTGREGS